MIVLMAIACGGWLIVLGLKGFTPGGIPFSKKRKLSGMTGNVVGACCVAVGTVLFFAAGWCYVRYFLLSGD